MSNSRYRNDAPIRNGQLRQTARAVSRIRLAVKIGDIFTTKMILQDGDRLDKIAARFYGDGRLWWIIAAASNVGWPMQVPPGTVIKIPTELKTVMRYV